MIFRLIAVVIIAYLAYVLVRKLFFSAHKDVSSGSEERSVSSEGEELVQDPCCGTYVPASNAYKVVFRGKTLYFCSKECFKKYKAGMCDKN
jgi:YHS domain-containing protein